MTAIEAAVGIAQPHDGVLLLFSESQEGAGDSGGYLTVSPAI
jgi:hypothetical protein